MTTPTIMLTGASGQLGRDLRRALMPVGEVIACARQASATSGLRQLDITDADSTRSMVETLRPRYIVNAAAYTAVDDAESEPEAAHAVNAEAVARLAGLAREVGAVMLHYSTDYVFSGNADRPWRESDATDAVNEYGRSKLAGEQAVVASGCAHLVLRTGWLYATHGRNFLLTMLRLREQMPRLRVVDDQIGAPTWTRPLATMSAALIAQSTAAGDDWLRARSGIYHAAAAGHTSWYGFTRRILARSGDAPTETRIEPVDTAQFPRPARRPAFSVLDGDKLFAGFGLRLPDWRVQLDAAMVDLGFDAASAIALDD